MVRGGVTVVEQARAGRLDDPVYGVVAQLGSSPAPESGGVMLSGERGQKSFVELHIRASGRAEQLIMRRVARESAQISALPAVPGRLTELTRPANLFTQLQHRTAPGTLVDPVRGGAAVTDRDAVPRLITGPVLDHYDVRAVLTRVQVASPRQLRLQHRAAGTRRVMLIAR